MKWWKRLLHWLKRSDIESRAQRPPLVMPPADPDSSVRLATHTDRFYMDPRHEV